MGEGTGSLELAAAGGGAASTNEVAERIHSQNQKVGTPRHMKNQPEPTRPVSGWRPGAGPGWPGPTRGPSPASPTCVPTAFPQRGRRKPETHTTPIAYSDYTALVTCE